jgi:hypothetical protein
MTVPEQPTPEALAEAKDMLRNFSHDWDMSAGIKAVAARIDRFAAQRAAEAVEQMREAHHTGWDNFRDTVKPRIFGARQPFEIKDAVEILNTHHYAYFGRALAATPPPGDAGELARAVVHQWWFQYARDPDMQRIAARHDVLAVLADQVTAALQSERIAAASQAVADERVRHDAAVLLLVQRMETPTIKRAVRDLTALGLSPECAKILGKAIYGAAEERDEARAAASQARRETIAPIIAALDLDGAAHARHNLDGAIIDLERIDEVLADKVCLRTLRRVRDQLAAVECALATPQESAS